MKYELSGIAHMYSDHFETAESLFRKQYEILRDAQSREVSIHKGAPLFNWGVALAELGKANEGTLKIAAAFIEDLITDGLPKAKDGLAFKALTKYNIHEAHLKDIEGLISNWLESGKDINDPERIAKEAFSVKDDRITLSASFLKTPAVSVLRRLEIELSGVREKRVFIGGFYNNIALLRYIRDIVSDAGYYPKLVGDIIEAAVRDERISLDEMHDASTEILEGCKYAVFEISASNGHTMEIKHCDLLKERGNEIHKLLLWQLHYEGLDTDPKVTSLIRKYKSDMMEYKEIGELRDLVREFLSDR